MTDEAKYLIEEELNVPARISYFIHNQELANERLENSINRLAQKIDAQTEKIGDKIDKVSKDFDHKLEKQRESTDLAIANQRKDFHDLIVAQSEKIASIEKSLAIFKVIGTAFVFLFTFLADWLKSFFLED